MFPSLRGDKVGKWSEAEEETLVDGKPALTMKCYILCTYACAGDVENPGITFIDDGQEVN